MAQNPARNNKIMNFMKQNKVVDDINEDIYSESIIERKIELRFDRMYNNVEKTFLKYLSRNVEGKCHKEGFIKKNSSTILSYTSGELKGDRIMYTVVFKCKVCYPYEGMVVHCKVINITKIGIKAVVSTENNPMVLFVSREHNGHIDFENFDRDDKIKVRVIGFRFEVNDEYLSVLGEII